MVKLNRDFILVFLAPVLAIACRDDDLAGPRTAPTSPPSFVISPGTGNECVFDQVRTFDEIGFARGVDAATSCNTSGSIHPSTPIDFMPDVSIALITADPDYPMSQAGPVTFTFQRPILNPVVVTSGNMACSGDFGRVIAHTISNATLTASFEIASPPDCGEDNQTNGYISPAIITTTSDPITRIEVTPPSTMEWFFSYDITICDPDCHNAHFEGTPLAHIGYAVYFREPPVTNVTVSITRAAGPNSGGSFTTVFGENKLALEATVTPPEEAGHTAWEIVDDPDDGVQTKPPTSVTPEFGATVEASVPLQDGNRWSTVTHTDPLLRKSLSLRVTAVVNTLQGQVRSTAITVKQDEIDTMREEYQELGKLKLPDRGKIQSNSGTNTGDYTVAVVNTDFDNRLDTLRQAWLPSGLAWSISSYFRNPVHNDYHITPRGHAESKHQYGCAADIRTTHLSSPPTTSELKEARAFWNQLNKLARRQGFAVEQLTQQRLPDHVHVQRPCQ